MNDLQYTISDFSDILKRISISNSNMNDNLIRVSFKNEERRIKLEVLDVELNRSRDDVILLKKDNKVIQKQRNIFCLINKLLYFNITQLHLYCEIGKNMRKMILPFS